MSTKTLSPGAVLLRTSRLFSLPSRLPPAPGDVSGAGMRQSDSATMPFPTRQALASPIASRKRGDWGLKRPLPSKITQRSTTPLVRIHQLDTIEQVTDYATATDHAMTLRKWQDIGLPLTQQSESEQRQNLVGKSVFEEANDVIHVDPSKRHTPEDRRWKFTGPWLAGITEGAFQRYLRKQVRGRRAEFRQFLRAQLAADLNRAASVKAMDAGTDVTPSVTAADITEAQLTEHLHTLRFDRPLLYRLVGKFLDLAPVEPSDKMFQNLARSSFPSPLPSIFGTNQGGTGETTLASSPAAAASSELLSASSSSSSSPSSPSSPSPPSSFFGGLASALGSRPAVAATSTTNPWAQDGPPITHPSAGLSYLRSGAYLENHPLYGPQRCHKPVTARVVSPRSVNGAQSAKLGVGGFITDNPFGESAYHLRNGPRAMPGLSLIDPKVHGGAKVPVRVSGAKVNSQGRVVVTVAEADPEAVLVQRELEGKESLFDKPPETPTAFHSRPGRFGSAVFRRLKPTGAPRKTIVSSPQNYGLGL